MYILFGADAPAGAGKTFAAAERAGELASRGEWVMIVQPSMALVEETYKLLVEKRGGKTYEIDRFHSGTLPPITDPEDRPTVTGAIMQYLAGSIRAPRCRGRILLCTHAAFLVLRNFPGKHEHWHVFLDEVPTVHAALTLDDFEFQRAVVSLIEATKTDRITIKKTSTDYTQVQPSQAGWDALVKLRRRLIAAHMENINAAGYSSDKLGGQIEICTMLLSSWYDVHVKTRDFVAAATGRRKANAPLTFYVLLTPRVAGMFRTFTVMSARLEETALKHLWRDCRFRRSEEIEGRLRYREHTNGNRMSIHYAAEGAWSKKRRDRPVFTGSNTTAHSLMVEEIKSLFGDEPFVWLGNNDKGHDVFGPAVNATRLPNSPHGLNGFQCFDNVAILSALNLGPDQTAFLCGAGFDSEAIRRAVYWNAVYQAIMRCSIRNPEATAPVRVVVPGKDIADWLAGEVFPGARVMPLECAKNIASPRDRGRPPKAEGEHSRATIDARIRRILREIDRLEDTGDPVMVTNWDGQQVPVTALGATGFASKWDSGCNQYEPYEGIEEFIRRLHMHWEEVLQAKEDAPLLSPAIFDRDIQNSANTKRGLANVIAVRGIMLDCDGGPDAISPAELADIFPELRIVVWNSFRSTRQAPRWRGYIPTTGLLTREAYDVIWSEIKIRLEEAGYAHKAEIARRDKEGRKPCCLKDHGLDQSKFTASSLFYFPSHASGREDDAFWHDFNDEFRSPLDPRVWIVGALNRAKKPSLRRVAEQYGVKPVVPVPKPSTMARAARQERALAEWRSCTSDYHDAFWRLTYRLWAAGMPEAEIRATLSAEAWHSKTPRDRQREIDRNLNRVSARLR